MSRKEIINKLSKKNPNLTKPELENVLNIFCENISNSLKNKIDIEIRGFGTFLIKKTKEKFTARNPKTGEIIYVPEKNKVRFKISKKLKELINK